MMTVSVSAVRKAQGPAPVCCDNDGCNAAVKARAQPQPTACAARSCGAARQVWPVWACTHSATAVMATSVHGAHSASWRSERASGSVSADHSANSCQASAPVW